MQTDTWVTSPECLQQDEVLSAQLTEVFRRLYLMEFTNELLVNHNLPVEVRAIRGIGEWRVFLLLTPWMLSRVYLRFDTPAISIPEEWFALNRANQPHTVLGPGVAITLLGQEQKTHLNYQPELGHYLVQPLIMRMEQFDSAAAVYQAWNRVIETRNENIRKRQIECQWQQEVSRREFFTRLRGGGEQSGRSRRPD